MDTNNETIIGGVCPHTNCTTQKFYTKEDYDKLQAENDNLKDDIDKQQLNVDSLEQENNSLQAQLNNITVQSNNAITALEQENERLKNEHLVKSYEYNYSKQLINTYKQALQEIRGMVDCANCKYESNDNCNPQQCSKIETKINEVIGAE